MDVHGHELSGIAVGLEGERGIRHGLRIVNLTQDVPSLTAISLAVWGDALLQCRHRVLLLPDRTVEHHPVEARCLSVKRNRSPGREDFVTDTSVPVSFLWPFLGLKGKQCLSKSILYEII